MEQNYNCELVQDLLPLYQDQICSAFSRTVVEEHLRECPDCQSIMQKLQDNHYDRQLLQEKNNILEAHARKERKKTFLIGSSIAGILTIPVIVCLICNLAIGHGLDWFFIVLAALLLTASVSVVPLMVPEHTVLWTLGCFTGSLLLLLFTICLYTGGTWFFLASVPVLFGLSILFMPYLIRKIPLSGFLARHKALLVMAWDTLWLYGVILVCGFHTAAADYWRIALQITTFCLLLPWGFFLIIRYTKLQTQVKAGVCTILGGLFGVVVNPVIALILQDRERFLACTSLEFVLWNENTVNVITALTIAAITLPAGIALIVRGFLKQRRHHHTS